MVYSKLEKLAELYLKKAMPIDTTYVRSLHDPELRSALGKRKVTVYHGTSSKNLAKIIAWGSLDPSKAEKTWDHVTPGIYVTRQLGGFGGAWLYANHSSQIDGSNPVVLELVIPINWISPDPDDTRYDEKGELNVAGEDHGIINRPVNIKNIKGVCFQGNEISEIKPGYREFQFETPKTKWLPFGTALRIINKKKAELPPEYAEMVRAIPRGLARTQAYEEAENIYANKMGTFYETYIGSPDDTFGGKRASERALIWLLVNKNKLWGTALAGLENFGKYIGVDIISRMEYIGEDNCPKPNETLAAFLKRVG